MFANDKFVAKSSQTKKHAIFIPNAVLNWDKGTDFTFYLEKTAFKEEILFTEIKFEAASWTDVIVVKPIASLGKIFEPAKPITFDLEVANLSNTDFIKIASLEMVSDEYKIEANISQDIKLAKGKTAKIRFNHIPAFAGAFKINNRITENTTNNMLVGNVLNGLVE